jgi:TPR repeat protein
MKLTVSCSMGLLGAVASGVLALPGCGPGLGPAGAPEVDQHFIDDTDPARARAEIVKDRSMPFVVDWENESRGDLETIARDGPAIVQFNETTLRLLPRCHADGSYNYAGFTPKKEFKRFRSLSELHANLPLSAAQLEARLRRSGQISIAIRMVGKHELDRPALKRSQLHGECQGATHFVRGMTIGAFQFMAGASQQAGGGAGVLGYGVQGQTGGESELMREDGNFNACERANIEAESAPPGCGAILRIELVPLDADTVAREDQTPACGSGLRWDGQACVSVARVQAEAQQQQPGTAAAEAPRGGFECDQNNAQECLQQCRVGNLPSCVHLGGYMMAGTGGIPKDEARALKLWGVACKGNEPRGCTALNVYYTMRQDWRNALIYGSKGCLDGDPGSCTNVAVQAFFGRGTAQNRPHAFKLWYRACKMRDFQACNNAGVMILHGMEGTPRDPTTARQLFQRACESPGQEGCGNLASCWEHGHGGPKDFRKAVELFLKACNETNDAVSCVSAGLLIEENSSQAEHRRHALELYEKGCASNATGGCLTTEELKRYYPGVYSEEDVDRRACEDAQQFALACYNAAIAHERGYGGVPNKEKAQQYLDKACHQGKLKKACRGPRVGTPTRI